VVAARTTADITTGLGLAEASYPDIARLVERGFPFQSLVAFQQRSGLALDQLSTLLRLPERTLARRRKAGRFAPAESDRLVRLAQLFERIVRLFDGDVAAARAWLQADCPAIGDHSPLDLLATEIGAVEVERLLGRLEHGVFS
jgi:putative toxin-antitoxin system antitoxin component (TIGR02293 family)